MQELPRRVLYIMFSVALLAVVVSGYFAFSGAFRKQITEPAQQANKRRSLSPEILQSLAVPARTAEADNGSKAISNEVLKSLAAEAIKMPEHSAVSQPHSSTVPADVLKNLQAASE